VGGLWSKGREQSSREVLNENRNVLRVNMLRQFCIINDTFPIDNYLLSDTIIDDEMIVYESIKVRRELV